MRASAPADFEAWLLNYFKSFRSPPLLSIHGMLEFSLMLVLTSKHSYLSIAMKPLIPKMSQNVEQYGMSSFNSSSSSYIKSSDPLLSNDHTCFSGLSQLATVEDLLAKVGTLLDELNNFCLLQILITTKGVYSKSVSLEIRFNASEFPIKALQLLLMLGV
jgi:hypothetical protein